jgi:hypothetical protein
LLLRCFRSQRFTFPKGNRRSPEGILLRSRIRESSDQQMHALTRGISQLATPFFVFQAKPSTIQRQRVGWSHFRRTPTQPVHDGNRKDRTLSLLRPSIEALFMPICIFILACALVLDSQRSKPTPNRKLFSKEVIRPQVPLRPPCYDFSPVAELGFDSANQTLPRPSPTSVKRRAVCARSRDVFTARW